MKYKVGDNVKIRSWESMKEQFGLDRDGDISTNPCFSKNMRKYCGKIMTIESVNYGDYNMKNGGGFYFVDNMFEPVTVQKIVITTDGTETLARLYDGKTVIKTATAKCSPDDTFDFNTGAKLAFERLMGEEKKEQEWRVVNRPAKKGDFIRLKTNSFSFSSKGDILKVHSANNGYVSVLARDHKRNTNMSPDYEWNYCAHEFEVVEPCGTPEKPETPKYFTGKAVCYEKGSSFAYTVGKVYEFKDGHTVNDNGFKACHNAVISLEAWNKEYGRFAKFIPFVE